MKISKYIFKIVVIVFLAVCTVFNTGINTVLAAENSSITQQNTSSSWNAKIPAYINPSEQGKSDVNKYSVEVTNATLESDKKLIVTINYDGTLKEKNNAKLKYSLRNGYGKITSNSEIISVKSGNANSSIKYKFGAELAENPKYAGNYSGKVSFNFHIVTTHDYTLEEIENDDHLFPIGKTQPEYVVAEFNQNYSEVEIYANGEYSDGMMMLHKSALYPMPEHKDTLKKAIIDYGVTTIGDGAFKNCSLLTDVTIPESVYSIGDLGEAISSIQYRYWTGAFEGCTSLKKIAIPDSVSVIGDCTFQDCTSLTDVKLPNNFTRFGYYAFCRTRSLQSITVPSDAYYITYDYVFLNSKINTVYGEPGSYAEDFARSYGFRYSPVS